jgi:hypothetical protein
VQACESNSCLPAPDRRLVGAGMNTPDRGSIGEWSRPAPGAMHGCQRMLLATAASFPVATSNTPLTCLRMLAGLSDNPSPQEPSAMDTSMDPPSGKDGGLER